ncbi:MAG: hypothetical protein IT290_01370 [Deltaproteobacteria bacterium]|nr:hypothetical protein [Deltaproteobacteria bacterium]
MGRRLPRRYRTISVLVIYGLIAIVAFSYRWLGYESFPEFYEDIRFLLTDPGFLAFLAVVLIFVALTFRGVFRRKHTPPRPVDERKR